MRPASRQKPLLHKDVSGQPGPAALAGRIAPRPAGVLVVDDQRAVRDVIQAGLQQEGFALWLAADGWEAVDLYGSHREAIDVVLLDIRMPGLDGPHTLAALRGLNPRVCCCFMTGDPGAYSRQDLQDLGAATVLAKPFRMTDVARMVRHLAGVVVESRLPAELDGKQGTRGLPSGPEQGTDYE